jgi:hypothetical protein
MESSIEECELILQLPDCELYLIKNNTSQLLQRGTLDVLEFKAYHIYVLQINSWRYSISKEIPILQKVDKNNVTTYVMPNMEGHYAVRITQAEPQIMEVLDIILGQHGNLFCQESEMVPMNVTPGETPKESAKDVGKHESVQSISKNEKQEKPVGSGYTPLVVGAGAGVGMGLAMNQASTSSQVKSKTESKITTEKVSSAIYKGGDFLKSGLVKIAERASVKIKSGGEYVKTKWIKKKEVKEVNPSTMMKIKTAKIATGAALTFTKVQVQGLVEVASSIANEAGKSFEGSETGKKMVANPNYGKAMMVGRSTVHATAAVFDGMVEALIILGRGFAGATTDIVAVKYGDKMAEATKDGLDCVGNIGLMARAYTVEGVKAVEAKTVNKELQAPNGFVINKKM